VWDARTGRRHPPHIISLLKNGKQFEILVGHLLLQVRATCSRECFIRIVGREETARDLWKSIKGRDTQTVGCSSTNYPTAERRQREKDYA